MTALVNEACIGCGLCPEVCPEVFSMTDAGVATAVEDVPAEQEEQAQEAAEGCPVSAIELEE